jgi:superfamily I DNA/RNA helicase
VKVKNKDPNYTTTILDAISQLTSAGEDKPIAIKIEKLIAPFAENLTQTHAEQLARANEGLLAAYASLKAVQNNPKISRGEKLHQMADILQGSTTLDDTQKSILRFEMVKTGLLSENTSPIGKGLLLNDEQDAALKSEAAVTHISAGAGSGKTRVLTGRILQIIEKEDVTPYNVIAVSFTKKSANELRSRVKNNKTLIGKASEELSNVEKTLIGRTIHSVASEICALFKPQQLKKKVIEDYEQYTKLVQAIELIKAPSEDPSATFNSSWVNGVELEPPFILSNEYTSLSLEGKKLGLLALNLHNTARYVVEVKKAKKTLWALDNLAVFGSLLEGDKILNPNDPAWDALVQLPPNPGDGSSRGEITPRAHLQNELIQERGKNLLKRMDLTRTASVEGGTSQPPLWWKVNASEDQIKAAKLNPKSLGLYITKAKSEYLRPYDCVQREKLNLDAVSLFPAAYGAYQYLLDDGKLADHDDTLIAGVAALSDPEALAKARARFKHILVDEAQDLNQVQRDFFGLIIGTHNVESSDKVAVKINKTSEVPTDGKSITFIGDPKQTIYGFRGASSDDFVKQAAQGGEVEGVEKFDLVTNFRSGRNIVKAANKLIENVFTSGDQGLCYAPLDKEDGIIKHTPKETLADATKDFAEFISATKRDDIDYRDFGLACRTNNEVIPYALALFEKGIPFRSGVDPFKHPVVSSILKIMNIFSDDKKQVFLAVKECAKELGYKIPPSFDDALYRLYADNRDKDRDVLSLLTTKAKGGQRFVNPALQLRTKLKMTVEELDELVEFMTKLADLRDGLSNSVSGMDFFNKIMGLIPYNGIERFTNKEGHTLYSKFEKKKVVTETVQEEGASTNQDTSAGAAGQADSAEDTEDTLIEIEFFNPLDIIRRVISGLNNPNREVKTQVKELLDRINKVREDAKKPLSDFTEADLKGKVTLDTVHGWKGLECKHIFVPMSSSWPRKKETSVSINLTKPKIGDDGKAIALTPEERAKRSYEEEARLAYVAVTRGENSVTILSYNKGTSSLGSKAKMGPSEFIEKMGLCPVGEQGALPTTDLGVGGGKSASYDGLTAADWAAMVKLGFIVDEV